MQSEAELVCPRCHRGDQIQRVSSVVEAGTSVRGDVTVTTGLATKLKMPPTPFAKEPVVQLGIGCGCLFLVFMGLMSWGAVSHNNDVATFVFIIANVVWISWVVVCNVRHFIAQRDASHNRRSWPQVERRWVNLYYCHRDECVFDGRDTSRNAPSARMRSLLFEGLDLV
jgi:hypothetical protein